MEGAIRVSEKEKGIKTSNSITIRIFFFKPLFKIHSNWSRYQYK